MTLIDWSRNYFNITPINNNPPALPEVFDYYSSEKHFPYIVPLCCIPARQLTISVKIQSAHTLLTTLSKVPKNNIQTFSESQSQETGINP